MSAMNIPFYLKTNAFTYLQEQFDRDGMSYNFVERAFSVDLLDRTVRCHFESTEDSVGVKLFLRTELGMYDDFFSDLVLTVFADGREPQFEISGRLTDNPEEQGYGFMKVATVLADMVDEFAGLNPDTEGVLVKLLGGEVKAERVSGRRRPAMLCRTLFGGEQMARPYQDEANIFWGAVAVTIDSLLEDAQKGDEDAMERVANAYLNGDAELGAEVNECAAAEWFGKLAELEHAGAQFQTAIFYLEGSGVKPDAEKALYWMERAKLNGEEAAFEYVDYCRQLPSLQKKAAEGDAAAGAELAQLYMTMGKGLNEDSKLFAMAVEAAEQAAEADVPEAMWVLAQAYACGTGVPKNSEQVLYYYKRGSELGNLACLHNLGCLYLKGGYLIPDAEKGFAMCMQAAQQGYGPAMKTVGECYQFGDGVPSSMVSALEWYEKYLECNPDPYFAQELEFLKTVPGLMKDSGWDIQMDLNTVAASEEFYSDFDFTMGMGMGFQSDSIAATFAFNEAEEYERELLAQGLLPDAPTPDRVNELKKEAFPRVMLKAEEGDARALSILETIEYASSMSLF